MLHAPIMHLLLPWLQLVVDRMRAAMDSLGRSRCEQAAWRDRATCVAKYTEGIIAR